MEREIEILAKWLLRQQYTSNSNNGGMMRDDAAFVCRAPKSESIHPTPPPVARQQSRRDVASREAVVSLHHLPYLPTKEPSQEEDSPLLPSGQYPTSPPARLLPPAPASPFPLPLLRSRSRRNKSNPSLLAWCRARGPSTAGSGWWRPRTGRWTSPASWTPCSTSRRGRPRRASTGRGAPTAAGRRR